MESEKDIQKLAQIKSSEINKALGLFILAFGIVIIFATLFTNTFIGQMTNLTAGIILSLIGGGMVLKAKSTIKKLNLGK
jgi:hypothetical protein